MGVRSVKSAQLFTEWSKIQQLLCSDQGAKQLKFLAQSPPHYLDNPGQVCSATLKLLNHYAFKQHNSETQNQLESPRVKNAPLKAYFSIPYYCCQYFAYA